MESLKAAAVLVVLVSVAGDPSFPLEPAVVKPRIQDINGRQASEDPI